VAASEDGKSWMDPAAKRNRLLYVADCITDVVSIFSYPADKQVGSIAGLAVPEGECVDKAGDIWITETKAAQIVEFAHGGTSPIAKLDDPGYYPVSCAVDEKSGDLAVSNIETNVHGLPGNVATYAKAQGPPAYYSPPGFYSVYFVGYDPKGNLFVDGSNAQVGANGKFQFAELARGAADMEALTLKGADIAFPGNVQWDGSHITVGVQDNAIIYALSNDKVAGSTPLTGSSDVVGYIIDGKTVVGPDAGAAAVDYFAYPAGGTATKTIPGFTEPIAAAISN
jgi:hypothetical protein